ncbi:MAG: chemotaxis protein CheB [Elusimicrobiales bacterium]
MKGTGKLLFPVAAIGASAGGLKAFSDLLGGLPPAPGIAFVIVPHLAPQYKSQLAEILARNTRLPVGEVKNGEKVLPNRIYVLPPNRAMLIKRGALHLSSFGHKSDWRNPIDSFFRSLALDRKKGAIGVLLSGEGDDGTDGLRAIKESGGRTFAQDGATAAHPSMPNSAAAAGFADLVLSPVEIGKRLVSASGVVRFQDRRGPRNKPKGEQTLNGILELLRTAKGVDFELYKQSTLRRRIQRRMTLKRVREPERYFNMLKADPAEVERLYGDILICVTSFFREPDAFKVLKREIYPRILKNRPAGAPVRIWVPGCSTGEEAYSHAINLMEFLGPRAVQIPFQIFATDVNPAVIEKARLGLYPKKIKADVSPERLRRFFLETKDGYRISPVIRERCVFTAKNLLKDPPFINLDLVSCRNLMIYLGPSLQEKVLQIFQYALKPRGILMLGHSETIGDPAGGFSLLDVNIKVFFERTSVSNMPPDFIKFGRFMAPEPGFKDLAQSGELQNKTVQDAPDLQRELESVLPARYVPNGVIINGDLEILRFLGDTSAYLRPAPGKPGMNLRRMSSGELLLELRTAVHMAKRSACAVRKEISAPHAPRAKAGCARIEVLPIKTQPQQDYFLVLFEEIVNAEPVRARTGAVRGSRDSRRVIELKEDLAASGEQLKAIIEEQESNNVKLKVSNEELLSGNEELQSVNEEFETAKEELQSTNEELVTSTEELGDANRVLNLANNDFSNLLANIDIPIVLLGPDLAVRRFTPPAEKALEMSQDKIGRSIADIRLPLRLPNLKQLLLGVIRTGHVQKLEVQGAQGRWHYLFIRPYRTDKSKTERSRIDGAVMALVDIQERKLAERNLLRLATVVLDSNDAVIICDLNDRITAWNKGAQKMYGYSEEDALGMNIRRLMPENKPIRARELVRVAAAQGKKGAPIEARRHTRGGRILDVLLTVTVLRDEKGRPVEVVTTERDITERKRAEQELRGLHGRALSAQETERKRLACELHDGVGQILSGVKFRLEALPGEMALGGKAAAKIVKVSGALSSAIAEVRRVSQNLMPSELVDLGLEAALRTLCREFKARAGVPVTLHTGGVPTDLAPGPALALFRIAQEALNNTVKHSRAATAAVDLSRKGGELVLTVSDNGIGFRIGGKRPRPGRGIGLESMRERAELAGGSLELHSTPGAGTTLSVRIPLTGPGGNAL